MRAWMSAAGCGASNREEPHGNERNVMTAVAPSENPDSASPRTRPRADHAAAYMARRAGEWLEGTGEVELICEPAFDYGRVRGQWTVVGGGQYAMDATGEAQTIRLRSDIPLGIE